MSDEENKTRSTTGVKFSSFTEVQPEEGNPIEVVGLRDGNNVRATLTTDLIETNPNQFRDRNGRFAPAPEELEGLTNQRSVNEFLWKYTQQGSEAQDELKAAVEEGLSEQQILKAAVAEGLDLQGEIGEGLQLLKDKVEALEGAVGEHALIFSSGMTPEDGEFTITIDGMSASNTLSGGTVITMSGVDRDGKNIAIDRITEGDVLRLSDIGRETAELKITSVNGDGSFGYEKLFGELDRLSEYPYDFNLFSSFDPAGLATVDYVDARVHEKIGRRAIWSLYNDTPWILRQETSGGENKQFIKIHDGTMNLENVATPSSSREAANKSYVDQAIAAAIATIVNQQSAPKPAQLSWKWGGESTNAPGTGSFCKNGSRWKFNKKTLNGVEITLEDTKSWGAAGDAAIELSIWRTDGAANKWKMIKHLEIDHVDWAKEYGGNFWIEFHQMWESNKLTLVSGAEYYVCVGGFF